MIKFFTTSKISENIHETPEGYLVCVAVPIARIGEMVYGQGETPLEVGSDGKVIISRDAKEVFRPETIASFEGKAITIGHPADFVDPKNWNALANGTMQNVRRGEGETESDLVADLLITVARAIELVKAGLREVSLGYEAEYTQTGIGRGFQSNIIGNHLALVDEGRAGSGYAIHDHKGKGSKMKLADRIKAIFAKAQDEALKVADCVEDEAPPVVEAEKTSGGYDAIMKAVKDLGEKVAAMAPGKDATTKATENQPAVTVAKDDETVAPGLEERLTKLEAAVSKLLEGQATGDAESDEDDTTDAEEDGEESEDADGDDMVTDESQDSDTASRVEILAPGMDPKGKDVKRKALVAAFATKDGKAEIEKFIGDEKPDFKGTHAKLVDLLFVGVSEGLKASRTADLSRTKVTDFTSQLGIPKGAMTPEAMNERNAKFYAVK